MKKLIMCALITFSAFSFADFTFSGYRLGTPALFNVVEKKEENKNILNFTAQDNSISDKINEVINKEINILSEDKDSITNTYISSNNSKFLSVVLVNIKENTAKFKGLVFDAETGEKLSLSNLLAGDYNAALKNLLNNRIKQFGIKTNSNFKGMESVSSFYLEDDALILIFDKGQASDDFDGIVFIPLFLIHLQEILK